MLWLLVLVLTYSLIDPHIEEHPNYMKITTFQDRGASYDFNDNDEDPMPRDSDADNW